MRKMFLEMNREILAAHDHPPSKYTYADGSYVWKLHVDDPHHPHDYIDNESVHVPIDFGCTAAVAVVTATSVIVGSAGDAAIIVCPKKFREGHHHDIPTAPGLTVHGTAHMGKNIDGEGGGSITATSGAGGHVPPTFGAGGAGSNGGVIIESTSPSTHPHTLASFVHKAGGPSRPAHASSHLPTDIHPEEFIRMLTPVHRGDVVQEQQRIESAHPGMCIFTDGYVCPINHPTLNAFQINLTRSLGHKLFREVGIIPDPYVAVEPIPCEFEMFVLIACSDGVTDELPLSTLAHASVKSHSARHLVEDITTQAHQSGKRAGDSDDSTAAALFIRCMQIGVGNTMLCLRAYFWETKEEMHCGSYKSEQKWKKKAGLKEKRGGSSRNPKNSKLEMLKKKKKMKKKEEEEGEEEEEEKGP